MAAAGLAATIDSALCNIICFIVGVLYNDANSNTRDNKVGGKSTKINWKERPMFWPNDICFVNPNTNLTTPEKWSMLFAALSCLLRKDDVDKHLPKGDYFVLCVELMALENSNMSIMNWCHGLRLLMKVDLSVLKKPSARKTFSYTLQSIGLSLVETSTDQDRSYFSSLFDDAEQECKNGHLPIFLQKLSTFCSMKSLDANSAMEVAKECLKHKSTRASSSSKRPCANTVPGVNTKRRRTKGPSASSTATFQVIPTTASSTPTFPVIPTTASSTPTFPVMPTTASSTTTFTVRSPTASSTPTSPVMPTPASSTPPFPVRSPTASSTPTSPVMPTPASSRPTFPVRSTIASSTPTFPIIPTSASSTPTSLVMPTTTSPLLTSQCAAIPTVTPVVMNTNDPLLSSSGSHRSIIALDRSNTSLHDQARNTFNDGSFPGSHTWTPSQDHCETFDSQFMFPDMT